MKGISEIEAYVEMYFGVSLEIFVDAMRMNPSAQGYILGAISEFLLRKQLISEGFEVVRIKEKPKGGTHGKSSEARGDFYVRKPGDEKWLVIECKGLKSNAEFSYSRRKQLSNKEGLKKFLEKHAIRGHDKDTKTYETARASYEKSRAKWEKDSKDGQFLPFGWSEDRPGPCNCDLTDIWKVKKDLEAWVKEVHASRLTEKSYRGITGPIAILETHAPSRRKALLTGVTQAGPLVDDFSVMAVDLFLRTKTHHFVFMNPLCMNHSPGSPEHLYQNYIVDILVPGVKDTPIIAPPWYQKIDEALRTDPVRHEIDESQIDDRKIVGESP